MRRRAVLAGLVLVAAGLAAAGGWWLARGGRAPEAAATPVPPRPGLVPVGRLFRAGAPLEVENRDVAAVAWLPAGARIPLSDAIRMGPDSNEGGINLTVQAGDGAGPVRLRLRLEPVAGSTWFHFRGRTDRVDLWPDDRRHQVAVYLVDLDGRPHPVALDAAGYLYAGPEPVPPSAVVNPATGEVLDLSRAETIGWLPVEGSAAAWTDCEGHGLCSGHYLPATGPLDQGRPLMAPADGELFCLPDGALLLRTEGLHLEFRRGGFQADAAPPDPCRPGPVAAGEPIGPVSSYRWVILAFQGGGGRISLALAPDGTLYAGAIFPTVDCPCLPIPIPTGGP